VPHIMGHFSHILGRRSTTVYCLARTFQTKNSFVKSFCTKHLVIMDIEEGLAQTGGFFNELFGVDDGWAHYDAHFADEEGETSKAKFDELVGD